MIDNSRAPELGAFAVYHAGLFPPVGAGGASVLARKGTGVPVFGGK